MLKQYLFLFLMSLSISTLGMSSSGHLQSEQEKVADTLLQAHVQKYYPGHKPIMWKVSKKWCCTKKGVIKVPQTFVDNPQKKVLGSLDHELCHLKFKDCEQRSGLWMRLLHVFWPSLYQKKCIKQEQRADEAVINRPDVLKHRMDIFKLRADFATTCPTTQMINNAETVAFRKRNRDLIKSKDGYAKKEVVVHPADAQRSARCDERYGKILIGSNQKLIEFFGTTSPVPKIKGTSPQKAARLLGLDKDYYPRLSKDMREKMPCKQGDLRPTTLTAYYLVQQNRFATRKAIEYIPVP